MPMLRQGSLLLLPNTKSLRRSTLLEKACAIPSRRKLSSNRDVHGKPRQGQWTKLSPQKRPRMVAKHAAVVGVAEADAAKAASVGGNRGADHSQRVLLQRSGR